MEKVKQLFSLFFVLFPALAQICPPLDDTIPNGAAEPGSFCSQPRPGDPGFVVAGQTSGLTCSENGAWSDPVTSCLKVRCRSILPTPTSTTSGNYGNKLYNYVQTRIVPVEP